MNEPDDMTRKRVANALSSLADVPPPAALEARVMRAYDRRHSRRWAHRWPWALAAGTALAAVLLTPLPEPTTTATALVATADPGNEIDIELRIVDRALQRARAVAADQADVPSDEASLWESRALIVAHRYRRSPDALTSESIEPLSL